MVRRRRGLPAGRCATAVAVHREAVHAECVGQEVEVLALVSDGVGASQPQGVVEGAVDGMGVVASPVQAREVRVAGGDGADVLGAVELPLNVVWCGGEHRSVGSP